MSRVHHLERDGDEAKPVHGRADHWDSARAGLARRLRMFAANMGLAARRLDVSDANWLKALEDDNAKLKKLLAEPELDKEIAAKKW
jgi:hypothetical protein